MRWFVGLQPSHMVSLTCQLGLAEQFVQHREEVVFGIMGNDRYVRFHLRKAVVVHDERPSHRVRADRDINA